MRRSSGLARAARSSRAVRGVASIAAVALLVPVPVATGAGLVQQGLPFSSDPGLGTTFFGWHVALSDDGNTSVIGGPWTNRTEGAAWIFERVHGAWSEAAQFGGLGPLTGHLGSETAISADGSTALAVGSETGGWVFVRSGGRWSVQAHLEKPPSELWEAFASGAALSADGNTALLGEWQATNADRIFVRHGTVWTEQAALPSGEKVALSSDGDTAVIAGPQGLYVYVRSGATWTDQLAPGQIPTETSVALSGDGNTLAVGAETGFESHCSCQAGEVFIYERSGGSWSRTAKLTGPSGYGRSLAVSRDGSTLLVGGPGVAFRYKREGTEWVQDRLPLAPEGPENSNWSASVALSADGTSALVSTWGEVWAFGESVEARTGSASAVTQTLATLNATVNPDGSQVTDCHFEYGPDETYGLSAPCEQQPGSGEESAAVSVSIGDLAPESTYHFRLVATGLGGTRWGRDVAFATLPNPPQVASVSPDAGFRFGGAQVTITGSNLGAATAVDFGGVSATGVTVTSPTSITATAPAGSGTADVTVTTPGGVSALNEGDRFTYVVPGAAPTISRLSATKGPAAGGLSVTVTGTHLSGVTSVKFGASTATRLMAASGTAVTAVTPATPVGPLEVTVATPNGQSTPSPRDLFTALPTVQSVSARTGSKSGGYAVTVTGSGFALGSGTVFGFGRVLASAVDCTSTTTCTMIVPATSRAGLVDIEAHVGATTSKRARPADEFRYY
jgi:hypothetical protein